jgi:hypothetical protein
MLKMIAHVISVRFGVMENEITKVPFTWAKVMAIEDEIEDTKGFIGQRVVEYSVPAEYADNLIANAKHNVQLPSVCELEFQVAMSGGKATLKCIGLNATASK